jgi:hypothetical protein
MSAESDPTSLPALIPPPAVIRARLAVVLTEADVLRRQLRVSVRAAKESDRLQRQSAPGSPEEVASA